MFEISYLSFQQMFINLKHFIFECAGLLFEFEVSKQDISCNIKVIKIISCNIERKNAKITQLITFYFTEGLFLL